MLSCRASTCPSTSCCDALSVCEKEVQATNNISSCYRYITCTAYQIQRFHFLNKYSLGMVQVHKTTRSARHWTYMLALLSVPPEGAWRRSLFSLRGSVDASPWLVDWRRTMDVRDFLLASFVPLDVRGRNGCGAWTSRSFLLFCIVLQPQTCHPWRHRHEKMIVLNIHFYMCKRLYTYNVRYHNMIESMPVNKNFIAADVSPSCPFPFAAQHRHAVI